MGFSISVLLIFWSRYYLLWDAVHCRIFSCTIGLYQVAVSAFPHWRNISRCCQMSPEVTKLTLFKNHCSRAVLSNRYTRQATYIMLNVIVATLKRTGVKLIKIMFYLNKYTQSITIQHVINIKIGMIYFIFFPS
jgi:hypothetical protein